MNQLSPRTKAYLMVLIVTLAGAVACWFLLGQIEKLSDDSEAVANLPFRHGYSVSKPNNNGANTQISLKIGQTFPISDELSIKLLSVNDSRCLNDPNVRCIWAGKVSSKIELFQSGVSIKILEVDLGKSFSSSGYNILFSQVMPKEKKSSTKLSEYLLNFKITN